MKSQMTILNATMAIVIGMTATKVTAQNFEWVKGFGGTSGEFANSITVDDSGNVLTAGFFSGTVDFDPGAGTANLTSAGESDIFVQKMDASGNFLWAKTFGGTSNDLAFSITVDAFGNVYTTGYFRGTVDFDPGTGTANLTSGGSLEIFVQKMNASGNFIWAKAFGGSDGSAGNFITVDASGNVYTTGYFNGTADFDPSGRTANLTSAGGGDVFIQKMDASGNFLWAKAFGGTFGDIGFSITVDSFENVYTTGSFFGKADFNPGAGIANLTHIGGYDVFIQKLDASGNFLWVKAIGGTSDDRSYSISVDASGNLYTSGYFQETVDFDPGAGISNLTSAGSVDVFIQKMDASGNFLWAKTFGGTNIDIGSSSIVDASGNVYTTGDFMGTVDFDPGAGTANLTSDVIRNVFVQKMDASGNFIWAIAFGGIYNQSLNSIIVDASRNVYTTGIFFGTADFDPGAGTANLTSDGNGDVFVQKMSQDSTTGIVELGNGINFRAFPIPGRGLVQILFEQELLNVEITVTDVQGRLVFYKYLDVVSNEQINITGTSGIYILKVKTSKGQNVVKIINE